MTVRSVIIHYHLFKNAGTSIDHILKTHFAKRWTELEQEDEQPRPVEVLTYLRQQSQIQAISSHTAQLPVPIHPDIAFFPIVFVRHPLDRIASAYSFERKQGRHEGVALCIDP